MTNLIPTRKYKNLVYDIGMHKGEDTEFYLQKGFRVIGFEADPELASACRLRFHDFVVRGLLTIVEGAILDPDSMNKCETKVRFYKNAENSVWGTVCPDWAERNMRMGAASTTIEVDAVDLRNAIQEYGVPHYLKIDIEGCDLACLKAFESFEERPDYVSIESDKTRFVNLKQEVTTLANLGYDSFQAIEQSSIPESQSPPYPATEGDFVEWRFVDGSSGLFGSELGGKWKSTRQILRQYRVIRLGYYLLGDDGLMSRWSFPGSWVLQSFARKCVGSLTKSAVPGWYDTHARHSKVNVAAPHST